MHLQLIIFSILFIVVISVPIDNVRVERSPHFLKHRRPGHHGGQYFGGGNEHYPSHYPSGGGFSGSQSQAQAQAGHGSAQSQSQAASFSFGPFTASLSQSQAQAGGGRDFFDY